MTVQKLCQLNSAISHSVVHMRPKINLEIHTALYQSILWWALLHCTLLDEQCTLLICKNVEAYSVKKDHTNISTAFAGLCRSGNEVAYFCHTDPNYTPLLLGEFWTDKNTQSKTCKGISIQKVIFGSKMAFLCYAYILLDLQNKLMTLFE